MNLGPNMGLRRNFWLEFPSLCPHEPTFHAKFFCPPAPAPHHHSHCPAGPASPPSAHQALGPALSLQFIPPHQTTRSSSTHKVLRIHTFPRHLILDCLVTVLLLPSDRQDIFSRHQSDQTPWVKTWQWLPITGRSKSKLHHGHKPHTI